MASTELVGVVDSDGVASSSVVAGEPPTRHERSSSIARTPQTSIAASIASSGSASGAAHRSTPSWPENAADTPSKPSFGQLGRYPPLEVALDAAEEQRRPGATQHRHAEHPQPEDPATVPAQRRRNRDRHVSTTITRETPSEQPAPVADGGATRRGDAFSSDPRKSRSGQEKLDPQPHVRVALGFVIANPDWSSPSL